MALKIYDKLKPQGNYPAVDASDVEMPNGERLPAFLEGFDVDQSIKTFDLASMGLPTVDLDTGESVRLEMDTTEITEAMTNEIVKFVIKAKTGAVKFDKLTVTVNPGNGLGVTGFLGRPIFLDFSPIAGVLVVFGKIVNLSSIPPTVTEDDDGKVLRVLGGAWTAAENEEALQISQIREQLDKIQADLDYTPIAISSMICPQAKTYEKGTVVDAVNISWELNKSPSSQKINNEQLETDVRTKDYANIASNITYELVVTDERGATSEKSVSLSFVNGVYYGVLKDGQAIDSASVLSLTRNLQASRGITFTASAGAGYRHAFALPAEGYGTPAFKDSETGFQAGFYLAETFEFTNRSGYAETYNVWLSTQMGLGSMTVAVS